MPLTRHLYEIDEVVSALQICLCKGNNQGLFWLWELVVSQEEELASETLTMSWLLWGGGHDPMRPTTSTDNWVKRYSRIQAAICAAGTLNAMHLLAHTAKLEERPSMTPLPATVKAEKRRQQRSAAFVASVDPTETIDAADFWISFDAACRQGCRVDAIWLLQAAQEHLSADAIWTALTLAARGSSATKDMIAFWKKMTIAHQILYQTAATLFLCIPTAQRERPLPLKGSDLSAAAWAEWNAQLGRRKARVYAIPKDALHTESTRGSIPFKYTNIADIRDPVPLLSEGCKFWQETMGSYTIDEDDTILEIFYDRYFPDDVPDEWSKADQEKSHGRGCQETALSPPTGLYIRDHPVTQRAWNCGIHVRPQKR